VSLWEINKVYLVSQHLHSSIACIHAITATSGDILVGHFKVSFYLSAETEGTRTYSLRSVALNLKSTGGFYERSRVGLASNSCFLLSALQHRAGNTSGSHEASVCQHTLFSARRPGYLRRSRLSLIGATKLR
jgi:hypothetical protein